MPLDKPLSISADRLTDMVSRSAAEILNLQLDRDNDLVGFDFHRPPWILGFILRDHGRLADASVAALTKTAEGIAANVEGPNVPAVLIRNGGITVGFFPEVEVDLLGIGR